MILILMTAFINAFMLSEIKSAIDAHHSHYIYGTISTEDGESYTGQIRWGKEEAYWYDHFNSTKIENENLIHLSRQELKDLDRRDSWVSTSWFGWSRNHYYNSDHSHSFTCQFGDIQSIKPQRGSRVKVQLKNGETIRLSGGSNDIGATVRIHDSELGIVKLDWDNIAEINFHTAPADIESAFGAPLYGTVETTSGDFTGYIQWDHDERMADDELNGDTRGGELDIPFGKIKLIEKTFRGSEVTMNSGRVFHLTGSNDVDDDNRGIIVNILDMGRVDIPWDEFIQVTFETEIDNQAISPSNYTSKQLNGSVETIEGKNLSGDLIFDLDEFYDLEILDGDNEGLEYSLPFRYISSIKPKNDRATYVTLQNGKKLLLEDSVDVTEDNDGILIKVGNDEEEYEYIPRSESEEIKFN